MKRLGIFFGSFAILALIGCGGGGGNGITYTNASMEGVWMLWDDDGAELGAESINNYLTADGAGNFQGTDGSTGTYSVAAGGDFTGVFEAGTEDESIIAGYLTSLSTGYITEVDGVPIVPPYPINRVTDPSVLQGQWEGTMTEDCNDINYPDLCDGTQYVLTFIVDAEGTVTGGSLNGGGENLDVTGSGAYAEGGNVIMSLNTNDAEHLGWIMIAGSITGDTITGVFRPDYGGESPMGTVQLTLAAVP